LHVRNISHDSGLGPYKDTLVLAVENSSGTLGFNEGILDDIMEKALKTITLNDINGNLELYASDENDTETKPESEPYSI
jgi:hypothetical protein